MGQQIHFLRCPDYHEWTPNCTVRCPNCVKRCPKLTAISPSVSWRRGPEIPPRLCSIWSRGLRTRATGSRLRLVLPGFLGRSGGLTTPDCCGRLLLALSLLPFSLPLPLSSSGPLPGVVTGSGTTCFHFAPPSPPATPFSILSELLFLLLSFSLSLCGVVCVCVCGVE